MPERTSKENRHWHYYRVDEDGNGRTSTWVDKKTGSKHFHRITKFVVEAAGRDEHVHDLRGTLDGASKDYKRKDGSTRMDEMRRPSSQKDDELEKREIERLGRRRRRPGMKRQRRSRRFNDSIRELRNKGY